MIALVRRALATRETSAAWTGRRFRLGRADCARLAADHLARLGWEVDLPGYRTVAEAARALDAKGYSTPFDGLDAAGLGRIAPAAALVGDVVGFPHPAGDASERLRALGVVLGDRRALAWHQDMPGCGVVNLTNAEAAWAADPR